MLLNPSFAHYKKSNEPSNTYLPHPAQPRETKFYVEATEDGKVRIFLLFKGNLFFMRRGRGGGLKFPRVLSIDLSERSVLYGWEVKICLTIGKNTKYSSHTLLVLFQSFLHFSSFADLFMRSII